MKQNSYYSLNKNSLANQCGVVLFFALIALVVMSLAAVALIRSVDTSTLIAGNLSYKQSASTSADAGVETGIGWLASVTSLATLDADSLADGYYATSATDPTTLNWNTTDSLPAKDASNNIDVNGKDLSGNTVRYVIQRMCKTAAAPTEDNCLFGAPAVNNSGQGVKDATQSGADVPRQQSPVYRITSRVVGIKNTISYVQAFVY